MKVWLLIALAACGSSAATPGGGKSTVVSNTTVPSGPDVHRSRHAIVKAAAAALSTGDAEALVALASPKQLYESALTCSNMTADQLEARVRDHYTKAATSAKGTKLEVVHIKQLTLRESDLPRTGCTIKKTLAHHRAKVKIKTEREGRSRERTIEINLFELDDRWYLSNVPENLGGGGNDVLAKIEGFSRDMCSCKDKACADKVNEEYTKWGMEMAKNARDEDARDVDPDAIKQMTEAATRYTECYTKLAMAAGNPCSP